MDTLRQKILTIIEKNSRIDMRELAVLLGTGEIEVLNAMQEMQEEGIICGYHTMIDWEKTGIERPQRGKGFDDIAERIYKYPEVDCTYLISGGYDLMVILEGKTLKEVSGFVTNKLSTLDTVISTATHFILKKYKDHGTIMTKKHEDQRELVSP